jgi:hypothetical protein
MRHLLALGLACCVGFASHANAQQSPLTVRNAGAYKCQQFSNVFSGQGQMQAKQVFLNWIAGYATGTARAKNIIDVFPIGDTFQFVQYVVLVCNENLQLPLENAVAISVNRLEPFHVKGDPARLTLQFNNQKMSYAKASVKALQQGLLDLGAKSTADGAYGNKTGGAIQQVSQAYGIGQTPFPSGPLLYVMTKPK